MIITKCFYLKPIDVISAKSLPVLFSLGSLDSEESLCCHMHYSGRYNPREARMREKGKWCYKAESICRWWLQAGHSPLGKFQLVVSYMGSFQRSHAKKLSLCPQSSKSTPQSFTLPYLHSGQLLGKLESIGPVGSQLGHWGYLSSWHDTMVEAEPTAWLLTQGKAETVSGIRR